jgi:methionine-gamma-lyase
VDNTFASPAIANPLALGADLVVHSTTKYIGGHSDLIGGIAVGPADRVADARRIVINAGGNAAPFEAFLALRGLKTLALRMERHSTNALAVATALEGAAGVARVLYPGLASHPQHELAERQLRRPGGTLAFEVVGGLEAGSRVVEALELGWIGGSLGGVMTLVAHPASTTHRQVDPDARRAAGISDGLIRVAVGLEDPDDLTEDFTRALEKA